jgi:hypothetical protein
MTKVVPGLWPVVCDSDECNQEAIEEDRERAEQARHDAESDGYSRYGGPGPDHY